MNLKYLALPLAAILAVTALNSLFASTPAPAPTPAPAAAAPDKPDPNFYIFLCFGQSNMEGYPTIEARDRTGADDRFEVFQAVDAQRLNRHKDQWYPANAPICRQDTGICPVDYFGRTLEDNLPKNIRIGVVNVAVAGCGIELFQKEANQQYLAGLPQNKAFIKNISRQYNNDPYQYLVDTAKLAQKYGVIKGILLHQGESNVNDKQWPDQVNGIYQNLLTDLNLKADQVPLLAGELVNADERGSCASMNTIIDQLPKTIPTSHVISSSKCPGRGDGLHFSPAGYREFGKRYALAELKVLGINTDKIVDPTLDPATQPATQPSNP